MAIFYGEVIVRNSREILFSLAAGRGDALELGLRGQVWFPLGFVRVAVDPESRLDVLICPTEIALLRRSQMAEDKLSREELERYAELQEKRLQLTREADALEKEAKLLKPKILAYIKQCASKSLAVSRWGFRLAIKLVQGQVKWQDEFIRLAGGERAAELKNAAPQQERLEVERAA